MSTLCAHHMKQSKVTQTVLVKRSRVAYLPGIRRRRICRCGRRYTTYEIERDDLVSWMNERLRLEESRKE